MYQLSRDLFTYIIFILQMVMASIVGWPKEPMLSILIFAQLCTESKNGWKYSLSVLLLARDTHRTQVWDISRNLLRHAFLWSWMLLKGQRMCPLLGSMKQHSWMIMQGIIIAGSRKLEGECVGEVTTLHSDIKPSYHGGQKTGGLSSKRCCCVGKSRVGGED